VLLGTHAVSIKALFKPKGNMGNLEKSENFISLKSILFEICKKNYRGVGSSRSPHPVGIALRAVIF